MDSRERLAEFVRACHALHPTSEQLADLLLASDWLRDTLAAERERCAKVCDKRERRQRGLSEKAAGNVDAVAFHFTSADEAAMCALHIRNLEPEANDDRG